MATNLTRSALLLPAALVGCGAAALLAPAVGHAAQCGPGTVYDAPTDSCVIPPAAPAQWDAPPPPPAPPPLPPLPPISICPPIPFVPVCFPVN